MRPRSLRIAVLVFLLAGVACAPAGDGPAGIALATVFEQARVTGTPAVDPPDPLVLDFEGDSEAAEATAVVEPEALYDIDGLSIVEGAVTGTTGGDKAALHVRVPDEVELDDVLHAVEIRLRASDGTELGLDFSGEPELPEEFVQENIVDDDAEPPITSPIVPGEEFRTYALTTEETMLGSLPVSALRHMIIRPTEAGGAEFAIDSIRIISRREYLQGIPSGVSWQGLSEIYRETIVTRTPERVEIDLELPSRPWLDLAVGMIQPGVSTFRVALRSGQRETGLLRRTVTKTERWEPVAIDLSEWAGSSVTLVLSGEAEDPGTIQYWGSPAIRQRMDRTATSPPTEAREALGGDLEPPHGVLVILADTLRRDRVPWNGGERDNAPNLTRLAEEGTVFTRTVVQGTWTKVSVPSILTSLYPTSHGISDIPDRLPASVTTLAEALREAGYATYATSSVPFTGKLTNLHQGVEVLHERGSIDDLPYSGAKTARTYVDRLLPWLDENAASPFFVFLHVFDPHSPLRPYEPYDTLYTDPGEIEEQEARADAVRDFIEDDHMRRDMMPTSEQLAEAEVDADAFVDTELDWYDGSIRGMDAEIGRVLERLEQLGVADDTLIVFLSDHGEEFLEHGRHFHGRTAYGEMLNVPSFLWWPGVVPATRSEEVVQSIDVMPTILELVRVPVPKAAQGQSLLPLMASPDAPLSLGWIPRPAYAERRIPESFPEPDDVESFVIIADGWKLIRNGQRPEDWPEFELYRYEEDPLDQNDLAAENPEVVEELAAALEAWLESATAARVEEDSTESMSPEDLERLRSLGYIR